MGNAAGASGLDFVDLTFCAVRVMFEAYWWTLSYACIRIGVIVLELEPFLVFIANVFLFPRQTLEIVSTSFDQWELACAILDVDHWMACGPMSKAT